MKSDGSRKLTRKNVRLVPVRACVRRTPRNLIRIELERRKQEIEREKDELKQFYSEAFECSTHSVNHDPNFLQLLDDVVVSIFLSKLRFP